MSEATNNRDTTHQRCELEIAGPVSANDSEDGRMALEGRTRNSEALKEASRPRCKRPKKTLAHKEVLSCEF